MTFERVSESTKLWISQHPQFSVAIAFQDVFYSHLTGIGLVIPDFNSPVNIT